MTTPKQSPADVQAFARAVVEDIGKVAALYVGGYHEALERAAFIVESRAAAWSPAPDPRDARIAELEAQAAGWQRAAEGAQRLVEAAQRRADRLASLLDGDALSMAEERDRLRARVEEVESMRDPDVYREAMDTAREVAEYARAEAATLRSTVERLTASLANLARWRAVPEDYRAGIVANIETERHDAHGNVPEDERDAIDAAFSAALALLTAAPTPADVVVLSREQARKIVGYASEANAIAVARALGLVDGAGDGGDR